MERRGWLDALVLHIRSRDLSYGDFAEGKFVAPSRQRSARSAEEIETSLEDEITAQKSARSLPTPNPHWVEKADLLNVMHSRHSGGPWTNVHFDEQLMADLLAWGNHEALQNRRTSKTVSAEGSSYDCSSYSALETFVVCNHVAGIAPGVYRYAMESHQLVPIREGSFQQDLVTLCIGQTKVKGCAAAFLISAYWARYFRLYRHARAYRNLMINTAELAHSYILAATASSLSNFITPAFNDAAAAQLLGRSNIEVGPLYLVAVG